MEPKLNWQKKENRKITLNVIWSAKAAWLGACISGVGAGKPVILAKRWLNTGVCGTVSVLLFGASCKGIYRNIFHNILYYLNHYRQPLEVRTQNLTWALSIVTGFYHESISFTWNSSKHGWNKFEPMLV